MLDEGGELVDGDVERWVRDKGREGRVGRRECGRNGRGKRERDSWDRRGSKDGGRFSEFEIRGRDDVVVR